MAGLATPGRTRALLSVSAVILVLIVAAQQCSASEDIKTVIRNLDIALRNSVNSNVQYSDANLTLDYKSSTEFNPRGMGTLYNVTKVFMSIVQNGDILPQDVVYVKNGVVEVRFDPADWQKLVQQYAGLVGVVVAGVLFVVLMPCVGLIFCCCRCAGRCGSRSQPFEKRRDPCRRVSLGIFLSAFTIVVLFGVVCAFVTNEYMEDGIKNLHSNIKTGLEDTDLYLNNTNQEVHTLLVTNYRQLEMALNKILHNSGAIVQEELTNIANATVLRNLTNFVAGLETVRDDLGNISTLTDQLSNDKDLLETRLKQVKVVLEQDLRKCDSVPECQKLLNDIKNLTTSNFDDLPSIRGSLAEVTELLSGSIPEDIKEGIAEFDKIQKDIQKSLRDSIPEVEAKLRVVGSAMEDIANNITQVVHNVQTKVKNSSQLIGEGKKYLDEYEKYRYYKALAMSGVLLVVLLCLTFGLFYGFCGKRPDEYGADCCTRGTGAKFLMIGVYLMFLFSAVLMLLTLIIFLIGLVGEKAVCEPLKNPENNQLFSLIDRVVNIDTMYPTHTSKVPVNVSSIIRSCHNNNSMYMVMALPNVVDISQVMEYKTKYGVDEIINGLKTKVSFNTNVTILQQHVRVKLNNLKSSELTQIDFNGFSRVLLEFENINLTDFAVQLDDTANKLADSPPVFQEIKVSLKRQSVILQRIQGTQVKKMSAQVEDLKLRTESLQENIKFNRTSLKEAVTDLIDGVEEVEEYLHTYGNVKITELVDSFFERFLDHIGNYLYRVVSNTTENVGRCGPLSQVYNATLLATCDKILNPFNGFWASIGWSLVLFIPAIILSVKLASLYRKSDSYPGPSLESEYLYDAYADRDNIPLANVHDKKNHHRRYDETYDNSSGYMGDYSAHLGRGRDRGGPPSVHNDARYTDMAPKYTRIGHWDYPNGGPPRYHSSPLSTEYERPPPYYYPGPGDSSRR